MDILGFETVDSLPCLFHPEMELLVLSDLHLGLEGAMTFDGNYVPKHQLQKILEDIRKAKKETDASKILINGDMKNEFKTSRHSEKDEINQFLGLLDELFEQKIIIEGNHDTFLESVLEKYNLEAQKFFLEDKILFTHGQISLSELEVEDCFETIVIGHEHPALALKDDIGVKEKVDCFLYGESNENWNLIVLPAFSRISNGINVNETPQKDFLSPVMREKIDVSEMKVLAVSREAGLFSFPELKKI